MFVKSLLTFLFTFLLLESVVAWTIDLAEARKYYFENGESKKNEIENDKIVVDKQFSYYDNINVDSPLSKKYNADNKDDVKEDLTENSYAGNYEYKGYMEKKVTDIVHKGSRYLEGLNQAVRQYGEALKNCSRFNRTDDGRNSSWLPENENPFNITFTETDCDEVTKKSEYVRRLAALALWATRELQDLSYNEKYGSGHESEQEENEVILRLAWFLDRLAQLTGFEPDGAPDLTTTTQPTTVQTTPRVAYIQQPPRPGDTGNNQNCIPTSRGMQCRYPVDPEEIRRIFGDPPQRTSSNIGTVSNVLSPNPSQLELSTDSSQVPRNLKKRSLDDNPLIHVMKYYVKHKVWVNSNPNDGQDHAEYDENAFINHNEMQTKKNVKNVHKRSISNKKGTIHLPEDPNQDLSNYLKHKSGVNYIKNAAQMEKIRAFMEKIQDGSSFTAKSNVKRLEKSLKSLKKRSIERSSYWRKKEQPRNSDDPEQDISYYVKNKRGTNYVVNLAEDVRLRAGLEQVFQTGNLEVVRRYGSHYNPAIPSPLVAGAAEASMDI